MPGPDRDGQRPQAGRPASGQGRQMPAAGGRPQAGGGPQAGGPQAGRGQARPQQSPYTSPQTGGRAQAPQAQPPHSPQPQSPQAQSSPPRPAQPYQRQEPSEYGSPRPPQAAAAEQTRAPEPFEEAAFADAPTGSWGDEEGTTAIGKLGYVPKEPRKRSDFQKKRSRARKTSPIPKIIAAIVVLGLLGGAGWWWFSRDDSTGEQTQEAESGLTYGKSEDPCSLADAAPLEQYTGDVEAEATAAAEQKNSGWEQSCTLTYGAVDSAVALLEFEAVSYDSDARASVSFEMSTGGITGSWTQVDPAPEIGAQAAAVVAIPDDGGTSNYQLHVQDGNVYLIVRLALVDSGLDQQGLTDLTVQLADSYLAAWRDAS
ncbi:hypothetical protein [Glycomyces arizonensis]|uniref:hypothetical protein n=1 Tax=Glycomyces arizonensis TaxID=256035 RepID=UPI0004048DEF|nr:hypothetical protein [Glycomyces arizonensis]